MQFFRLLAGLALLAGSVAAATFGTVVTVVGGASDIVLDELRARLYLVNSAQNRIEVYSTRERRFLNPVRTDARPLTAAIDRVNGRLYVTSFDGSNLNVIDLETLAVVDRIGLPARPEGVAVGGDGRVLITTIGSGVGNTANVLLRYDPFAEATQALQAVNVALPAPQNPQVVPPSGRVFLTARSQMVTSADGNWIIGVNLPNAASRVVFAYEVASGSVLRTRTIANASSVLSVSPDGSKFMAGLTLFDTGTLSILAQQNIANSPFPYAPTANFNVEQNQGGSTFSPDGGTLYTAFNVAPIQNPPARANVSQFLLNDPDNLLTRLGLQMPENLAGKMVISSDSANVYALSESGFVIIPLSTLQNAPVAVPELTSVLLANNLCVTDPSARTVTVNVRNDGRTRFNANAALLQVAPTSPGPQGSGPGTGLPGGAGPIPIPTLPGGGQPPPVIPGGVTPANPAIVASSPSVRVIPTATGSQLEFTFVVQSNEAVNIPSAIRVFQNFRDVEARGEIVNVPVGLSAYEALEDLVYDAPRQRIYLANSGLNRVEVFDVRARRLLEPIKVGQLPRSIAMSPDGFFLYVANSGGENISVIDLDRREEVRKVFFPPLPANVGTAIFTPSIIAVGLRGMSWCRGRNRA
jgi:DNA-binding beta-propeller fold protein YncE